LRRHELDSIKLNLKEHYHFANDIDKTVFIGYDNKKFKVKRKKSVFVPFFDDLNWRKPTLVLMLSLLCLFLLKSVSRLRKIESEWRF